MTAANSPKSNNLYQSSQLSIELTHNSSLFRTAAVSLTLFTKQQFFTPNWRVLGQKPLCEDGGKETLLSRLKTTLELLSRPRSWNIVRKEKQRTAITIGHRI